MKETSPKRRKHSSILYTFLVVVGEVFFVFIAVILVLIIIVTIFMWSVTFVYTSIKKAEDPCYGSHSIGKGFYYEIKDDRVCMEYESGINSIRAKKLEGADPKTFEKMSGGYFKDKKSVYYGANKLIGVNPNNFKELKSPYYKDDRNIFQGGKKMDVDYDSFKVLDEKYGYAKDKDAVYNYSKKVTIVEDPQSFILLGENYGKDKFHVYHDGSYFTILKNADPVSFEVIKGSLREYAKDNKYVYHYGTLVEGADPETFIFMDKIFARDKNYLYRSEKALKNIDINNFEQIGNTGYVRDEDSLYYYDEEVRGVNIKKFRIVAYKKQTSRKGYFFSNSDCGTDGTIVICHGELISGGEIVNDHQYPLGVKSN